MSKHHLLAVTLALVCSAVPAVVAQNSAPNNSAPNTGSTEQQAAPAAPERRHGHGDVDPVRRAQKLTRRLKLTPDQASKVQDILKSEQSQMEALRSDASLQRKDRRSRMMEIHKASDSQITTLLDPGQQKKFAEMQSQAERRHGHRHGNPPPAAAPDSSEQK